MAEKKEEILALGRDALRYLDAIKNANKEIVRIGLDSFSEIKKDVEDIKKASDNIKKNTLILEKKEQDSSDTYKMILSASNKIKQSYDDMVKKVPGLYNKTRRALTIASSELENMKHVESDLAAVESKIRDIREPLNKHELKAVEGVARLSRLLRRDRIRISRQERMGNRFLELSEESVEKLKNIISYLENIVIPAVQDARNIAAELSPPRYRQLNMELDRDNIPFIADFFNAIVKRAETTLCSGDVEIAVKECKDSAKDIEKNIAKSDAVIERFSSRYLKQLTALEMRIRTLENMGILEKISA